MIKTALVNSYFEWLCRKVCNPAQRQNYSELLYFLHSVEFTSVLIMDRNRAEDGTSLRYRYSYEKNIDSNEVYSVLDEPCSVLEMMVALSIRCEEDIMGNNEEGDRTGKWFWKMIESLGLSDFTDSYFDLDEAEIIISRFLARDYDRNGQGGLFTVPGSPQDLRDVEIWIQMNWYINPLT